MTDNGSCYLSRDFGRACRTLGLKHIRTKPYTPKTNGKAERFIQTSLREWAYARAYNTSHERTAELPQWLHRYNWHRPHGSIGSKPPISRLGLDGNKPIEAPKLASLKWKRAGDIFPSGGVDQPSAHPCSQTPVFMIIADRPIAEGSEDEAIRFGRPERLEDHGASPADQVTALPLSCSPQQLPPLRAKH